MRYRITADCRSCGEEQTLELDMSEYEDVADDMVIEELDRPSPINRKALACANCGDQDWNPYPDSITAAQ